MTDTVQMTGTQTARPKPARYSLYLEPDLTALTFAATATLRFEQAPRQGALSLDAVDLEIESCRIREITGTRTEGRHGGGEWRTVRWACEDGMLSVEIGDLKTTRGVELEIRYHAELTDKMVGFYRSRYLHRHGDHRHRGHRHDDHEHQGPDAAGAAAGSASAGSAPATETRYVAVTQFEERDARRAFPCIDEPWAKAVFEVAILAQPGHVAISNAREASIEVRDDGSRLFRFEPTPPMSTYLVAFAVGPFDMVTDESWRIPIRVAVSPGKAEQGRTALTYARQSLAYLEELIGVSYPLGKLDSIAVEDFAYGAMENFGAIVYREHLLLTKEGVTTRRDTERIMSVGAHEIAHMWFGDLVSPAAWRYVWLNEAFATYFGNVVTEYWYPDWRMMQRFAAGAMAAAMERDALPGTVPIELEREEIEIDASTAPIIYNKGACVLRMIHGYYGDAGFRGAVRSFLEQFRLDAVDTDGFISVFGGALDAVGASDASDGPDTPDTSQAGAARELLAQWIRRPGFPVVSVAREGEDAALSDALGPTGGTLRLRQEPFTYLGAPLGDAAAKPRLIPITAATGDAGARGAGAATGGAGAGGTGAATGDAGAGGTGAATGPAGAPAGAAELKWLLRDAETRVQLPEASTWVKLNRNQEGYYRVFYEEPEAWDRLGSAAAHGQLSPLDRHGLVADLADFAYAGEETTAGAAVDLRRFLDFAARYYAEETDPVVIGGLAEHLAGLHSLFPERADLRETALRVLEPHREEVLREPEAEGEAYRRTLLRDPVLTTLIVFEDESTLERLQEWGRRVQSGHALAVDLVLPALRGSVRANPSFADWIMARLAEEDLFEAGRIQYLRGLAALKDGAAIDRVLELLPERVPSRNWAYFLHPGGTSASLAPYLWRWFREHLDQVADLHMLHAAQVITGVVPIGALGDEDDARALLTARIPGAPHEGAARPGGAKPFPVDRDVVQLALDRLELHRRFREREAGR